MVRKLTTEGFVRAAAKFKLLGDPARLRSLDLLREHGQQSVGQIERHLGCSQPTASRQLSKLHEAHMISRRRESNTVYYFIEDESVFDLCEAVCGRLERESAHDLEKLYETPPTPNETQA